MWNGVLANAMVVIILQYINVLNQPVTHLKIYRMLCVNYILIKLGGKTQLE